MRNTADGPPRPGGLIGAGDLVARYRPMLASRVLGPGRHTAGRHGPVRPADGARVRAGRRGGGLVAEPPAVGPVRHGLDAAVRHPRQLRPDPRPGRLADPACAPRAPALDRRVHRRRNRAERAASGFLLPGPPPALVRLRAVLRVPDTFRRRDRRRRGAVHDQPRPLPPVRKDLPRVQPGGVRDVRDLPGDPTVAREQAGCAAGHDTSRAQHLGPPRARVHGEGVLRQPAVLEPRRRAPE